MTPSPDGGWPPKTAIRLVIFDCDGVLVDSEGPSAQVVADEITALGWTMTATESINRFRGATLEEIPAIIEAKLGRPVPPGWLDHMRRALIRAFEHLHTMPGAADTLRAVTALGLPYRIASNSSHPEMDVKFARTGLASLIDRRQHSALDVPRGKPAPDVFLAAAAAENTPPEACLVIEDSIPGIRAARAAGMPVIGLDPHTDGAHLAAEGAHPIRGLAELSAILRTLQERTP